MEIKICGITKTYEIDKLIELGVEYAGFVTNFPKSRRNNTFHETKQLINYLNSKSQATKSVVVVVSPTLEDINKINEIEADLVQIHGNIDFEVIKNSNKKVIAAINISDEQKAIEELKALLENEKRWRSSQDELIYGILFDGKIPGEGKTFNWQILGKLDDNIKQSYIKKKFILAGGLNTQNVKEGMEAFNPDIVDCSSGVEYDDKKISGKDLEKIEKFVDEVRR